jgi:hypothetical protein
MRFFTAPALISSILTFLAVASADCEGQPPRNCNLVVRSYTPGFGQSGLRLDIYNNACRQIGFSDAVDSEPPYTVVLTQLYLPNFDLQFCYAGSCYTNPACGYGGGNNYQCQQAFRC